MKKMFVVLMVMLSMIYSVTATELLYNLGNGTAYDDAGQSDATTFELGNNLAFVPVSSGFQINRTGAGGGGEIYYNFFDSATFNSSRPINLTFEVRQENLGGSAVQDIIVITSLSGQYTPSGSMTCPVYLVASDGSFASLDENSQPLPFFTITDNTEWYKVTSIYRQIDAEQDMCDYYVYNMTDGALITNFTYRSIVEDASVYGVTVGSYNSNGVGASFRNIYVDDNQVALGNTPPVLSDISFTPSDLYFNESSFCNVSYSDADTDGGYVNFTFYIDGGYVDLLDASLNISDGGVASYELLVLTGDNNTRYQCCAIANDGTDDSNSLCSANITYTIEPSAPVVPVTTTCQEDALNSMRNIGISYLGVIVFFGMIYLIVTNTKKGVKK